MVDQLDLLGLDHPVGELVATDGVSPEIRAAEIVGFGGRPGRTTLPRAQIRPVRDPAQPL